MVKSSNSSKKQLLVKRKKPISISSAAKKVSGNKPRKETFSSGASAYLNSNPVIIPDKCLDSGAYGDVYTVKGNPNMVVKVPSCFLVNANNAKYTPGRRKRVLIDRIEEIEEEFARYIEYGLEHEPLFIPTRKVALPQNDLGMTAIGLLRPRVRVLGDNGTLTNKQIEILRRQLISISHSGLLLTDRLQLGIDKSGRPIQYDLSVTKTYPSKAFDDHQWMWSHLVQSIIQRRDGQFLTVPKITEKYGSVNPNEQY